MRSFATSEASAAGGSVGELLLDESPAASPLDAASKVGSPLPVRLTGSSSSPGVPIARPPCAGALCAPAVTGVNALASVRLGSRRIQSLLDAARGAGIVGEELDDEHVRLSYDARERDQWLVAEDIYEAVHEQASLEGDGRTEAAPDNWMAIHFDFSTCGKTLAP